MMSSFPAGATSSTVTFLFCDIEGSTRLWEKHPNAMQAALARHDHILRKAIEANQGYIVKTTGDGFHAAFPTALDGLLAVIPAQQALYQDAWPEIQPDALRSRMALFTGEAAARSGDFYGTDVNRAARLMATGHGGQILLSSVTADLVRDRLPEGASLLDLGEHRMRDLIRPEHIYQLAYPALPANFPPLNSLEVFPNNLPLQVTSFIGRESEIAEVINLLGQARMVTLIGPGGTGKTRLALQASADLLTAEDAPQFPDGVWLVEFARQVDPEMVVETTAEVFHLREMADSPPLLEVLTNYLRAKRLLLILDNCEHLIEACANLAHHLLRACPEVKILASSREAFGISGEMIHRVPSLTIPRWDPLPAPGVRPAAEGTPEFLEQLILYESVRLFVERAKAVQPRFSLTGQNARAVMRICQRLDGIPLALELAAARIRIFTPEQISARLDDRFRLLTGGSRTAIHRQQTLGALIDWSYDLLTEPERALFRLLSVFSGGWNFEAAEAVSDDPDVLDLLTNLVNKSMVIVNEQGSEARYGFLETIRQYARDKLLESGEVVRVRDQHLQYYVRLSESIFKEMLSSHVEWLDKVDPEGDNIRSAFEWGLERSPADALRLIGNFYLHFTLRTNIREAQRLAKEALSRIETSDVTEEQLSPELLKVKARGLLALGFFTMNLGEILEARSSLEQSVRLARAASDLDALLMGLITFSMDCVFMNDSEEAKKAAQECIDISHKAGFRSTLALSLAMLAWAEGRLGNEARRRALLAEQAAITKNLSNPIIFNTQMMLGIEARSRGDLETARSLLEQCLSYIPVMRSVGFDGMVRSELAHVERQSGNLEAAKKAYHETMKIWVNLGHRAAIAHQLECLAFIARAEGQYPRAARLFGAAEALRQNTNAPMRDDEQIEYEREVALLHEALPDPTYSTEWAEGQAMPMEEAILFATESGEE